MSVWLALGSACTGPPAEMDPQEIQLDAERRVVHATERVLLQQTAARALQEGRPREAVGATLLGMEVDPVSFGPLVDALAQTGDPEVLGELATRLDEARFGEAAARLELERRYRAGIPAALQGVTVARGQAVLLGVLAEYVAEPDEAEMARAARARLELLRPLFPGWTGPLEGTAVMSLVEQAIAGGLPEPVAVSEAAQAALGALDPYTAPVWPASLSGWQEHHAGATVGVGMELEDAPEGGVIVTALDVAGPAWRAGVHVGDVVAHVDGEAGPAAQLLARLHGEPGTEARLALLRQDKPLTLSVPRELVPEETVRGWRRTTEGWQVQPEPGLTWLRIQAFRPHTDEQLDELLPAEPGVVVLDLRGNGGGDVMAAVNVADRFVADGVLVTLAGRTIPAPAGGAQGELPWNVAVPGHPLEGAPVVVLVDRHTASAAEIVAGALRERAGAVLIGERTFGKGLAQALRVNAELGVGWQVTNGMWTLPSGEPLEPLQGEAGLVPDVLLALSPAERLQVAVMRRRRELPPAHPDGSPVPDLGTAARAEIPRLSADPQVERALAVARALRIAR
jgi:carboxyl-terminal processing protease